MVPPKTITVSSTCDFKSALSIVFLILIALGEVFQAAALRDFASSVKICLVFKLFMDLDVGRNILLF